MWLAALLRYPGFVWTSPFPRCFQRMRTVSGVPGAVKLFMRSRRMPLVRESLRHDADLDLCILPVEVPDHDALTQELDVEQVNAIGSSEPAMSSWLPRGFVDDIRTISSSWPGRTACRHVAPHFASAGRDRGPSGPWHFIAAV